MSATAGCRHALPIDADADARRASASPRRPRARRCAGALAGRAVRRTSRGSSRCSCSASLARHPARARRMRRVPALQKFGLALLRHRRLESGHQAVRRAGADLRHARHLGDRAADRRAGELRHRAVPHRDVPAVAEAPARHGGGAARRDPVASSTACGACSCSRRSSATTCSRCWRSTLGNVLADRPAVPGRAERHRHAVRRHHPVGHGHPVHRVGDARRVRDRAAGAEGIGVRPRLHDVGSGVERRAAVHARWA